MRFNAHREQHISPGHTTTFAAAMWLALVLLPLNPASARDAVPEAPARPEPVAAASANDRDDRRRSTADGSWREEAQQRIERHRKAELEITVRDSEGRPIPDAVVTARMTRHRFGFGALVGSSRWQDRPNPQDARRHLELAAERFNKVVTILRADEEASDLALDWLAERGIRVRGHYLMWAPVQPGRQRGGQPGELFDRPIEEFARTADQAQRDRIREAAFKHLERLLRFGGERVAEWDVVNHIGNDNHIRFSDLLGPGIYAEAIRRAREIAPHAEMWVNEGNVLTAALRLEKYHEEIRDLIARGAGPDGIGFMAHFREGEFTHPEEIYRRLDRFAALVPRLQLTEFDIDTSDEQLHAKFLGDVLTIAFSHPAVSGIVMWQIWGAGAGHKTLWRADWSIKPAGLAWLDHVFRQWWTEATGETDRDGRFRIRGFLGDYEISVRRGGQTKKISAALPPEGGAYRITF